MIDFNPPTPCGVGRVAHDYYPCLLLFQSTHPVRGGTRPRTCSCGCSCISIHPPRAGWDAAQLRQPTEPNNSNPPTPCGVGPSKSVVKSRKRRFQSTHPVRGGTQPIRVYRASRFISIHPPRAGWDPAPFFSQAANLSFQSTHPVRGGTQP